MEYYQSFCVNHLAALRYFVYKYGCILIDLIMIWHGGNRNTINTFMIISYDRINVNPLPSVWHINWVGFNNRLIISIRRDQWEKIRNIYSLGCAVSFPQPRLIARRSELSTICSVHTTVLYQCALNKSRASTTFFIIACCHAVHHSSPWIRTN